MSTLSEAAPAATGSTTELTYREAINAALDDAMAADDAVLLMGEDVVRRWRRLQDQHRAVREVRRWSAFATRRSARTGSSASRSA